MKEQYLAAEMELVLFSVQDVIETSTTVPMTRPPDPEEGPAADSFL